MQREVKKKDEKREEKYCRAVARQVDTALKRQQKSAAVQSRRRAKTCKKMEAKQQKTEEKRMRARRKTARKRAWNVKRNRPVSAPACGASPAYLSRMPRREAAGPGRAPAPAVRTDFIRAFWLTALLLLCPLLALWGMGEAYTAVRANGFADFTTPLSLPDTAGGGLRAFDFVLGADGLPLPVRICLEIVWRLWSPALRLTLQLLYTLPDAIQSAAAWLAGLL